MRHARLQKHAKLLKTVEFNRVFDKSVRSSDRYFTVLARPSEQAMPRLGMAITKRKVRLAVSRNRLKRIIRESFRLAPQIYAADYVVMAGQLCNHGSNVELLKSLDKHWKVLKQKCADF